MSAVSDSSNVIELATFRAVKLARRPAKPYVLWYPGVGVAVAMNSVPAPRKVRQMSGGPLIA